MGTLNRENSRCYFFDTLLQNRSTHSILEQLYKGHTNYPATFLVWYSTNSFGRITKRDIQTLKQQVNRGTTMWSKHYRD